MPKKKTKKESIAYYESEIKDLQEVIYNSKQEIKEYQKQIEKIRGKK